MPSSGTINTSPRLAFVGCASSTGASAGAAGSVAGEDLAHPKFHPVWATCEALAASCISIRSCSRVRACGT
jgi:hypothetical protein